MLRAGVLHLESHLYPFLLWLFLRLGLAFYLGHPGLQSSCLMLPAVAEMTDTHYYYAQLFLLR
jgi:hypothetical protein